jgi:predicted MFS family arabinose efflux permease
MREQQAPARDRWYVLIVLTIVYAINIADRFSISTLIEPIRKELELSDSEVGVLTGVALGIFYVLVGLPLGRLADRANRQRILTVALATWSLLTALCGLTRNYWQLFGARIGVGIGEAGGTPPSTSILADKFTARWRPLALSVFALGASLGSWIGTSLVGRVEAEHGWRASFLALGLPGLAVALLVWLTVREPRRGQSDAAGSDARSAGFLETLRYVRTRPAVLHFMVGSTVLTFWSWGLLWWTPAFLGRTYQMTVAEAGDTLGPMHLIAGTGVTLLAAWVMTHARAADSSSVMRLMTWVTLLAVGPSILVYATDNRQVAVALLWVFVPAIYFWLGPMFGVLQNLVPSGMRAQACALFLFVTNVANLIVAPQLIGSLSDGFRAAFGTGDASLRWALAGCATSGFWAAWHLWRCGRLIRAAQHLVAAYKPT